MSKPTDRELLIAAAAGLESAFTTLYRRYAPQIRQYVIRCLDSDLAADDLVQQVFVQLLASKAFANPHHGPAQLDKLLFTIAKNLVRNQQRGSNRRNTRELKFMEAQPMVQPAVLEDLPPVGGERLAAAIRALPAHQRQPILLRFRHGMDIAAIAELTNCPAGTVKSRIHYGLKRLAQILAPLHLRDEI